MNNKLLHERMKWGTVIAMGLALSMITSEEELKEGTSTQINSDNQLIQKEKDNHGNIILQSFLFSCKQ